MTASPRYGFRWQRVKHGAQGTLASSAQEGLALILRDLEAGNPAVYGVSMQPSTTDMGIGIVGVDVLQ